MILLALVALAAARPAVAPVNCSATLGEPLMRRICADPKRFAGYTSTSKGVAPPDVLAMLKRDQLSPSRCFSDVASYYRVTNAPMLDDGSSTDGNQGLYFAAKWRGEVVGLQVRATEAFAARTKGFPVETVRRAAPHQRFVTTDGGALPFDDGTFGSVFSQNVLEHAPDPRLYVDEALRVLKPGGVFFASWAPVWTSVSGHHVQGPFGGRLDPKYKDDGSIIPPWGHLWLKEAEMKRIFELRGMGSKFSRRILRWIYSQETVSRKSRMDVHQAFEAAATKHGGHIVWKTCSEKTYEIFDGPEKYIKQVHEAEKLLGGIDAAKRLRARNVTHEDLFSSHCTYVMRKSGAEPGPAETSDICTLATYSFHLPAKQAQFACAPAVHYAGSKDRTMILAQYENEFKRLSRGELARLATAAGFDAKAFRSDQLVGKLAARYESQSGPHPGWPSDPRFRSAIDNWLSGKKPTTSGAKKSKKRKGLQIR